MLLGIIGVISCNDKDTNSKVPQLEFLDQFIVSTPAGYDSLVELHIEYLDNDGDIGLSESDTTGPFKFGEYAFYNLFCFMYVKENGIWVKPLNPFSTQDTLYLHERFPNITPTSENKRLRGEITLYIPARPLELRRDSVRFEIQLWDRALNKSNVLKSNVFKLKHP